MKRPFVLIVLSFLCLNSAWSQDSLLLDRDRNDTINYGNRFISVIIRKVHPDPKYFMPVKVIQPANFDFATFTQMVFLDSVEFEKMTSFSGAVFNEGTEALATSFKDYCDFTSASFTKGADFTGSTFQEFTDFSGSILNNTIDFSQVRFPTKTNFTSLQLTPATQIIFSGATLPDTMDFSFNSQKLTSPIDLTAAVFPDSGDQRNKLHYILLYKTDISQFHLDYFHFRLLIPETIKIPDDPKEHRISDDEKESMYEGLLNNFNIHGQKESYRRLDIEYQRFKYYQKWWTIPVYWAYRAWWNFGYDKEWVFLWTFFYVLVFTTINYFFLPKLNDFVFTVDKIPANYGALSKHRKYWYSFVYTSIIFFKVTLNTDKLKFDHIWGTIYIMLIYASGLVCLAYIANFIIQK